MRPLAKARLQTAKPSPALDLDFPEMHTPTTKEKALHRFMPYPLDYDYSTHPYHTQYHPEGGPMSQTTVKLPGINPIARGRPQLRACTSLPQVIMHSEQFPLAPHLQEHHVQPVRSHYTLEVPSAYYAPPQVQRFTGVSASRLGPSVAEYDLGLRWPTRRSLYGDYPDNGQNSPPCVHFSSS